MSITPFLWFDGTAEAAATFYVTLFEGSRITHVTPGSGGAAQWVSFELAGRTYYAFNGGPQYKHTAAFSLFVECSDQAEVDRLWSSLTAGGGAPGQCGWLTDRFGLSWQIIPKRLGELLGDPDRARAGRVMQAMLRMQKIDVAVLEAA
jgi:predicted 3-demethylubiquinone-9 3-methyltransferase (glyoxalase superfamily)